MTLLRHTVILPCKRIARYTMYYTCIHIFWAWFFACVRTPQSYRVEYWMRKEHLPLPLYWIILIRGELICLELSFERIYFFHFAHVSRWMRIFVAAVAAASSPFRAPCTCVNLSLFDALHALAYTVEHFVSPRRKY